MANFGQISSKRVIKKILHIMGLVYGGLKVSQNASRVSSLAIAFVLCGLVVQSTGCASLDNKLRTLTYRPTPGIPADFTGLRAGDERYFVTIPAVCKAPAWCDTATYAISSSSSSSNSTSTKVNGTDTLPQRIEMWWLPHPDANAPTLLYLHGTFRTLYQNLPKIDSLREAGFAILAVDYRGWGLSTALTPSEPTIMQDARLALAELQRRELRPNHRFIYGHSMGTGVAVDLASSLQAKSDYGGLILESAFTSFSDIAKQVGVLGYLAALLNTERFESITKISKVRAPLLMMHGSLDTTVPMVLGKQLFDAANEPKQWVTFASGTHSRLNQEAPSQYQETVIGFRKMVTAD